jgi:hypothetical protein
MLSKCANPDCSEILRYLHQGKIFRLAPSGAVQIEVATALGPLLDERFWLCESCSEQMTVIWGGAQTKVVRLLEKGGKVASPLQTATKNPTRRSWHRRNGWQRTGREDR